MADLLAIKNYVMLFINDQADFMAEQANHTTYSWNIKWQKCARMGLNGFHIKCIISTHCNWKNQNPGSPLGAPAKLHCQVNPFGPFLR